MALKMTAEKWKVIRLRSEGDIRGDFQGLGVPPSMHLVPFL